MMVRELANKTQVISDINPNINRVSSLQKDLFSGSRHTIENLNETISDVLAHDFPKIEAEAVLYRIQARPKLNSPPRRHEKNTSQERQ